MANTLKFGNGQWATGNGTALAYNDENSNFKPLPFDFTRASSGTVVNQSGLIETVGSGIPRIDFQGNTKGALLLEPSRTNLITYSEDFSNAAWNKGTGTIIENVSISPDGTLSADKFTSATTASFAFLSETMSANASQTYTYSIWIKKVSGSGVLKLAISDVILATTTSANISLTTEFVRYSFTIASGDLSNTGLIGVGFINMTSGDVIEVWGAQLEQGTYATSYIPTSGSAVTRVADACNNGANEQVINSTEGVLYAEIAALSNDGTNRLLSLSNGTSTNRIFLGFNSLSNRIRFRVQVNNVYQAEDTFIVSDTTQYLKIGFKYKENDFALWINGVEVLVDNSGSTFSSNTLNKLNFDSAVGGSPLYGNCKDLRVYNEALSDAELQALTS